MNLAQKRQQLASLTTLKSLHRAAKNAQSEAERLAAQRAEKRIAQGLVGMRIGTFGLSVSSSLFPHLFYHSGSGLPHSLETPPPLPHNFSLSFHTGINVGPSRRQTHC